jgi:hypothetical protein
MTDVQYGIKQKVIEHRRQGWPAVVVFDLDGTVWENNRRAVKGVVDFINDLANLGATIVYGTARSPDKYEDTMRRFDAIGLARPSRDSRSQRRIFFALGHQVNLDETLEHKRWIIQEARRQYGDESILAVIDNEKANIATWKKAAPNAIALRPKTGSHTSYPPGYGKDASSPSRQILPCYHYRPGGDKVPTALQQPRPRGH